MIWYLWKVPPHGPHTILNQYDDYEKAKKSRDHQALNDQESSYLVLEVGRFPWQVLPEREIK